MRQSVSSITTSSKASSMLRKARWPNSARGARPTKHSGTRLSSTRSPSSLKVCRIMTKLRAELHAKLLDAYNHYGETDALVRDAKAYLANFPNGKDRSSVSLLLADGYARKELISDEFATYDDLLKELAAKSDNVPLGAKYARGAHNDQSTEQVEFNPYKRDCNTGGGTDRDNSEEAAEPTDQGEGEGEAEPGSYTP